MDRVLRSYAHTAWTPSDPLAGIEPDVRRAILMMPSTFRERWKLAPWTNRHQRRLAIADIVAERRLLYELTSLALEQAAPQPTQLQPNANAAAPLSPYYQYRMALHRETMAAMKGSRSEQDAADFARSPEARVDRDRRVARQQALMALDVERARLDVQELAILADREDIFSGANANVLTNTRRAPAKKRDRSR